MAKVQKSPVRVGHGVKRGECVGSGLERQNPMILRRILKLDLTWEGFKPGNDMTRCLH